MPYQVDLPIFEVKPSRLPSVALALLYVGLVFLFVNKFFFEIEYLIFVSLGFIFFAILIEIFNNKIKDAGLLYMDLFCLKINKSDAIPMSEISELKITIGGYEGRMTGFLKGMDSGNNNFIEFTHNNEKYTFRFFLSYQKMEMLDYISDKWKINSPQIFRKEKCFLKDFILRTKN
jgi:hypothetical protein